MDAQVLIDLSRTIQKLKMYPYFDMANYVLMCSLVKEDTPQTGNVLLSRRHPFASWLASMLMCFAGSIVANFLIGEPMINPFKNHEDIMTASVVWYLINYCPLDLFYRIFKFTPVYIIICMMKEVQRTKKIYDGVSVAHKLYPQAYLVIVLVGVVKGSGYLEMKLVERLVRGVWLPASNEFLQPSFTTKGSMFVAIAFLLDKLGKMPSSHDSVYIGALFFLAYFKLSAKLIGVRDPFAPFENITCALFFGGLVDALRRATEPQGAAVSGTSAGDSQSAAANKVHHTAASGGSSSSVANDVTANSSNAVPTMNASAAVNGKPKSKEEKKVD